MNEKASIPSRGRENFSSEKLLVTDSPWGHKKILIKKSRMNQYQNIELLPYKNYLTAIKNSPGSRIFQNLYAIADGTERDITRGGEISCALYASSLLRLFDLIAEVHSTVSGTVADLQASGWKEVEEPRPGAVLVWEEKRYEDGHDHTHIGFYIGDDQAVSNSDTALTPVAHHWTFDTHKDDSAKRAVTSILWNEQFSQQTNDNPGD